MRHSVPAANRVRTLSRQGSGRQQMDATADIIKVYPSSLFAQTHPLAWYWSLNNGAKKSFQAPPSLFRRGWQLRKTTFRRREFDCCSGIKWGIWVTTIKVCETETLACMRASEAASRMEMEEGILTHILSLSLCLSSCIREPLKVLTSSCSGVVFLLCSLLCGFSNQGCWWTQARF